MPYGSMHNTMKELPVSERPYEKCLERGPQSLSNAELLAVILKSGTRNQNSVELARAVLTLCGTDGTLRNLKHLTVSGLTGIPGIGKVKAVQILCVSELCDRIAKEQWSERIPLNTPSAIASYYINTIGSSDQEEMHLIFLDTKNRRIHNVLLTKGTVNASLVSTREVFAEALRYCAVSIIMVHNHPSGDPSPSREDLEVTQKVKAAGELLDIRLLDHIIIGHDRFCSLKQDGYLS